MPDDLKTLDVIISTQSAHTGLLQQIVALLSAPAPQGPSQLQQTLDDIANRLTAIESLLRNRLPVPPPPPPPWPQ